MRTLLVVLLATLVLDATAQTAARPQPPGTAPLQEAPPPPPITRGDPEPQVTTRMEGDQKIEEYRIGGKLYMRRVTPKHGKAYVLMDNRGDGTFSRLDNTLDGQVRVPQWVIKEF